MSQAGDPIRRWWHAQGEPLPPEVPPLRPAPEPDRPWPVVPRPVPPHPERPPHRLPGLDRDAVEVTLDLADRLMQRRIVFLSGPLDHDAANGAAARLMLLDADGTQPIELHLSCADGDLDAAITLAETLDLVRAPVRAVARGVVGGPPLAVYVAAGERLAHPHCVFQLREPRTQADGSADELAVAARRYEQLVRHVRERIAAATGKPYDDVADDLRTGRNLTAQEALAYGLVHVLTQRPKPDLSR